MGGTGILYSNSLFVGGVVVLHACLKIQTVFAVFPEALTNLHTPEDVLPEDHPYCLWRQSVLD